MKMTLLIPYAVLLAGTMATGVVLALTVKWGPDQLIKILQEAWILPRSRTGHNDDSPATADGELIRWLAIKVEKIGRKGGVR